jgi:hypothetical protein
MFTFGQLLFAAAAGALASLVALVLYGRWAKAGPLAWREACALAAVVGLSILLWRAAGNTPALNEDPIPLVSPNDVLCPVLTYVGLGLYAGWRRTTPRADWPRVRALLTIVSLVVNVVTI